MLPAVKGTFEKVAEPRSGTGTVSLINLPLSQSRTAGASVYTCTVLVLAPGAGIQLSTMYSVLAPSICEAAGHNTGRPWSSSEMFENHQLRNHQRDSFSKPATSATAPRHFATCGQPLAS